MHLNASDRPTQSAEALLSFVEGRELLRNYFGSGRSDDLVRARTSFSDAEQVDPQFALATFYLAMVDNELRDADAAISRLETLIRRRVNFLPEAYLQLAYAHTKKYTDKDFFEAEAALNQAMELARAQGRGDLIPLIEAYRAFLFSVMGGRLQNGARQQYVEKAIELGTRLLEDRSLAALSAYDRDQVRLEIHNALGISYMRKGDWALAHHHYSEALKISPNDTRVLQNIGTLLLTEGDRLLRNGDPVEAAQRYRAAQELYRRSLDLNSHDQFPHYRMAGLAARLGEWDAAARFYASGIQEQGWVPEEDWKRLQRAIEFRDLRELKND
jgi:tetratricopeptide (TPR) repeat protein